MSNVAVFTDLSSPEKSSVNGSCVNGKDRETIPLIERKVILKRLLRRKRARILYLDHVEGDGRMLFEEIVRLDLEGLQAERLALQGDGETLAPLHQGQEFRVQPVGRA